MNLDLLPYGIPPLVASAISLCLAFFTFKKSSSKSSICFSLLMVAMADWLLGFGLLNISKEPHAFLFTRILYTGVILIPPLYYSFIALFLSIRRTVLLVLLYTLSAYFIISLWSSRRFMQGNIQYEWGYSSRAGYEQFIFIGILFFVFLFSYWELYHAYQKNKRSNPEFANRIKYVLAGFIVALFASVDFLSTYGFSYYPLGFIFIICFEVITLWGILKHNLLDLGIVIKRGFLYSLFAGALSFFIVLLVLISNYFSSIYFNKPQSLVFLFVAASLLSVIVIPLQTFFLNHLSKIMYHGSLDELASQNTLLLKEMSNHDRLKSVATLAAGMAHEIKNPLTSIRTFAEFLPKKYDDPDFRKKFSALVVDEVDRVNAIIQQLLDFSKPKELDLERFELVTLIQETLTLLGNNILKSRVEVNLQIKAGLSLCGDKGQLKQVFLNLFLNALQAMPNGGLLTVIADNVPKGSISISISDTGPGIPKKHLSHIFDPFFTTKETGSGLGLAVVHGIVSRHGGGVSCKSAERGTCFILNFKNAD